MTTILWRDDQCLKKKGKRNKNKRARDRDIESMIVGGILGMSDVRVVIGPREVRRHFILYFFGHIVGNNATIIKLIEGTQIFE